MIVLNDFKKQWERIGPAVLEAVTRVGQSGWLILGSETEALEAKLAQLFGVRHAVGVGNGLEAIEIALKALGAGPADKVLTTPLSAYATTLAVQRVGATPVFVDVDGLGQIDLDQCRAVLKKDPAIRYLLPVHLYGFGVSLKQLAALRDEFGLKVIEDCAQSVGCRVEDRIPGTLGRAAATSFYPTKNLGALGDGGAVLTDDPLLADRAKALRNYGQTRQYVHDLPGLNSRLDELHAAILHHAILPHLKDWLARRRQVAERYLQGIDNPAITLLRPPASVAPGWHLFPVLVEPRRRQAFREHLAGRGVRTGVHYPRIIPDQAALREGGKFETPVPLDNARRFADAEVSLPIHPFLTDAETQTVVTECNQWRA